MSSDAFRVYLRALEPDDYKTSYQWRQDEEIWDMVIGRRYYVSKEYERQWVERLVSSQSSEVRLAVCTKADETYIGNIYLTEIDNFNKNAEFGKLIGDKRYWRSGYATEATLLMLRHAFYDLGLERISARQLLSNKASIRVNEKCGFMNEGIARRAIFKNGTFQDLNVMACLRSDFDKAWKRYLDSK